MSDEQVLEIVDKFLSLSNSTVRSIAAVTNWSKTSVHNAVSKKIKEIDLEKYKKCKIILEKNKNERHIRGGEATRNKYKRNIWLNL